jgi:sugar lactone lactonase YvrE
VLESIVEIGGREYRWSNQLLEWPQNRGWAHHDVATLPDGRILTSHPDGGLLLEHRPDGTLLRTIPVPITETHGIHVSNRDGASALWVADNGHKALAWGPELTELSRRGRVVRLDLDGTVELEIACPELPAYGQTGWQPCAVAALPDDTTGQGDGSLWVADGYGANLIHCFSDDGRYRYTIDGSDTGVLLDTPHALLVDERGDNPTVCVADRGNGRIVVFDLTGTFQRVIQHPALRRPSGMAVSGDRLYVTDLDGGVAVFGADDTFLGYLGGRPVDADDAWPNARDGEGRLTPPLAVREQRFNSPHGIAVDGQGRLLVSEWVLGGRVVCLSPA